jgi:hypothetical protein
MSSRSPETRPNGVQPGQSTYHRAKPPGFLERAGVQYYRRLATAGHHARQDHARIDTLPADSILQSRTRRVAVWAALVAALLGVASSAVPVWFQLRFEHQVDAGAFYSAWLGITLICTLLEFVALFWLSLHAVHRIADITGHQPEEDDPYLPGDDAVPNLLARAALELPDPVVRYLGVDPMKYISKPKLVLVGFLYKAKVMLTTVAAKFILQRLGGKLASRVGLAWLSVPVAAIWNLIVMVEVVQEARLRLYGHRLAYYLIEEVMTDAFVARLSPLAREGAIRAISTMMVMTQSYHPNMLILLYQFSRDLSVQDQGDYDDWIRFLAVLQQVSAEERFFLLDLLSVAAAFDGHLSKLERQQLPMAFGVHTPDYMDRIRHLRDCLVSGQIHAARDACQLDFLPG